MPWRGLSSGLVVPCGVARHVITPVPAFAVGCWRRDVRSVGLERMGRAANRQ